MLLNSFPCSLPPQNSRVLSFLAPLVFTFPFLCDMINYSPLSKLRHTMSVCFSLQPVYLTEQSWWFLLCHFTFYNFCLWKTFLFVMEIIFLYSGVHSRTIIKLMSSFPQFSKKSNWFCPFSFILLLPLWLPINAWANLPHPLLKYLKASTKWKSS